MLDVLRASGARRRRVARGNYSLGEVSNLNVGLRNNVRTSGSGGSAILFAHGYGCDQTMWRHVAPAFEHTHRVVLFDHVGAGRSDLAAWDPGKYQTLQGYAEDVVEIGASLGLRDAIFVGHSVSAMIGILAARLAPGMFARLVLVGPSPRYINDDGYVGGFEATEIDRLMALSDADFRDWSVQMASIAIGNAERSELVEELATSICRADPALARHFAHVTFSSDNRGDLAAVRAKVLILQCSNDAIAPESVGRYVHAQIGGSDFVQLRATGHCPHLSAPQETAAAIRAWLESGAGGEG